MFTKAPSSKPRRDIGKVMSLKTRKLKERDGEGREKGRAEGRKESDLPLIPRYIGEIVSSKMKLTCFFFSWKEISSEFQVALENILGTCLLSGPGEQLFFPTLISTQPCSEEFWRLEEGSQKARHSSPNRMRKSHQRARLSDWIFRGSRHYYFLPLCETAMTNKQQQKWENVQLPSTLASGSNIWCSEYVIGRACGGDASLVPD